MNWKALLVGTVLAVLVWVAGWGPPEAEFELTVLHTNDIHSHYESIVDGGASAGGAARLATLIEAARASVRHSLLLDAGDQFQGTLLFTVGGTQIVADVMNALGYSAMTIGNHEFDLGPVGLAGFLEEAEFPILSANIDASANTSLDGDILPFDVFLFDGEVVGVFGLTTETTSTASSPGPDVVFEPVARRARTIVEMLERQGVDKIIALTHLGYGEDLKLASAVDGIDVIVGGHSHTELSAGDDAAPYPTWVSSPDGTPVVVVTDGEWGRSLGRLDLVFDQRGRVVRAQGAPVSVTAATPEDPGIAGSPAPYVAQAQELLRKPIGVSDSELDGDRSHVRSGETNLGNAITDAMLRKTGTLGARVALMNGGGIRASIAAGPVTTGQVLEVLPFGNEITTLSVTGRELTAVLENGVSQVESGGGRFLQVAGIRFTYDPDAPGGARVLAVEILDSTTKEYRALRPEEEIVVATNDFLAGGGDGYTALSQGRGRYDTGWLLSDALAEHLQVESPFHVEVEGRIQTPQHE